MEEREQGWNRDGIIRTVSEKSGDRARGNVLPSCSGGTPASRMDRSISADASRRAASSSSPHGSPSVRPSVAINANAGKGSTLSLLLLLLLLARSSGRRPTLTALARPDLPLLLAVALGALGSLGRWWPLRPMVPPGLDHRRKGTPVPRRLSIGGKRLILDLGSHSAHSHQQLRCAADSTSEICSLVSGLMSARAHFWRRGFVRRSCLTGRSGAPSSGNATGKPALRAWTSRAAASNCLRSCAASTLKPLPARELAACHAAFEAKEMMLRASPRAPGLGRPRRAPQPSAVPRVHPPQTPRPRARSRRPSSCSSTAT